MKKRILVVEDNAADAKLIEFAFQEAESSADLTVVSDGETALALLNGTASGDAVRPDLILLDLNLPGKAGSQVLAELKNRPDVRRTPVIIFTSSMAEPDVNTAYDYGASLYLRKPSDLDEFNRVIAEIDRLYIRSAILPRRLKLPASSKH